MGAIMGAVMGVVMAKRGMHVQGILVYKVTEEH